MSSDANSVNSPRTDIGRGGLRAVIIVLAAILTIVAIVVALALAALRYDAAAMEASRAKWRQKSFDAVKSGDERTLIHDAKAIEMLARDADCISNLKHLDCSGVDFSDADISAVQKLVNLRGIWLYDCTKADLLIRVMNGMPSVESIGWESTLVSDDGIQSLSKFPNLERVHIEDVVPIAREQRLRETLPNLNLTIPNSEQNEPK